MQRTVVVTGCSSGLGESVSHALLNSYDVLGVDINEPHASLIENEGFGFLQLDLSQNTLEHALAQRMDGKRLYGIVHCAAVSHGGRLDTMTDEEWQFSMDVNLTSAMRLSRFADRHMVPSGRLLFISSPVSIVGANKPSYSASKAGLHGLMVSVSRTLAQRQIQVNSILPGPMITGMTDDWSTEKREGIARETHLGRLCKPEEVASMVRFLLSEECSYLTASVIDMTAGSMFGH